MTDDARLREALFGDKWAAFVAHAAGAEAREPAVSLHVTAGNVRDLTAARVVFHAEAGGDALEQLRGVLQDVTRALGLPQHVVEGLPEPVTSATRALRLHVDLKPAFCWMPEKKAPETFTREVLKRALADIRAREYGVPADAPRVEDPAPPEVNVEPPKAETIEVGDFVEAEYGTAGRNDNVYGIRWRGVVTQVYCDTTVVRGPCEWRDGEHEGAAERVRLLRRAGDLRVGDTVRLCRRGCNVEGRVQDLDGLDVDVLMPDLHVFTEDRSRVTLVRLVEDGGP